MAWPGLNSAIGSATQVDLNCCPRWTIGIKLAGVQAPCHGISMPGRCMPCKLQLLKRLKSIDGNPSYHSGPQLPLNFATNLKPLAAYRPVC